MQTVILTLYFFSVLLAFFYNENKTTLLTPRLQLSHLTLTLLLIGAILYREFSLIITQESFLIAAYLLGLFLIVVLSKQYRSHKQLFFLYWGLIFIFLLPFTNFFPWQTKGIELVGYHFRYDRFLLPGLIGYIWWAPKNTSFFLFHHRSTHFVSIILFGVSFFLLFHEFILDLPARFSFPGKGLQEWFYIFFYHVFLAEFYLRFYVQNRLLRYYHLPVQQAVIISVLAIFYSIAMSLRLNIWGFFPSLFVLSGTSGYLYYLKPRITLICFYHALIAFLIFYVFGVPPL